MPWPPPWPTSLDLGRPALADAQRGGTCGAAECSLEVAGSTDGMAGADLYAFAIERATSEVTLELSDLHAYQPRSTRS